jgi:hypothetical protein
MAVPRSFGFQMRSYVDADHATDTMTRKSRSGFLVYLNNAPIYWLSKKQRGVESSSLGSVLCAFHFGWQVNQHVVDHLAGSVLIPRYWQELTDSRAISESRRIY